MIFPVSDYRRKCELLMRIFLHQRQSFQQPMQLPGPKRHHVCARFRPFIRVLLQTLLPEAEPVAIPVEYLDYIPFPIAEGEQVPGEWVQFQVLRHQQ